MSSFEQVPVTAAVFTVATILLSGCIAYDAAHTSADAGATIVGTGFSLVSTTGSLVISPFRHGEEKSK